MSRLETSRFRRDVLLPLAAVTLAVLFAVVLTAGTSGAQLEDPPGPPTTEETTTTTDQAPDTTLLPTTTEATTTTTTEAPETTEPPTTEAPETTEAPPPTAPPTTADPAEGATTSTFVPPAGQPAQAPTQPVQAFSGEPGPRLLPWIIALSLLGWASAALIMGIAWWRTRPG